MANTREDWEGGFWAVAFLALLGFGGYGAFQYWFANDEPAPPALIAPAKSTATEPRPTGIVTVSDGTDVKWSVNADTIRGPRSERYAWVITSHENDPSVSYRTGHQYVVVNCETMGLKALSFAAYDAGGENVLGESYGPDEQEWDYYPPNTVGYSPVEYVCRSDFD